MQQAMPDGISRPAPTVTTNYDSSADAVAVRWRTPLGP